MADADGDPTYGVDANAVAAMFQQGFSEEGGTADPEPTVAPDPVQPVVDPAQAPASDEQTPATEDTPLGPLPDISDFPPELQELFNKRVGDFQSGFTKRTTELAEANRFLQDAGMSAEDALEAAKFVQQIQSDPEARAGLYQALKEQFEAQQDTTPTVEEDPLAAYEDLPPDIKQRLIAADVANKRIDAWEAKMAEQEKQAQEAAYYAEIQENLDRQYENVVKVNPDLNDEAIRNDIMALGAMTGGDLVKATDRYRAIENRVQAKMRAGANVPGGTTTAPQGAGYSAPPPTDLSFDDGSVGAAALEYLKANSGG